MQISAFVISIIILSKRFHKISFAINENFPVSKGCKEVSFIPDTKAHREVEVIFAAILFASRN